MKKPIAILNQTAFFGIGIFELRDDMCGCIAKVAQVYEDKYTNMKEVSVDLNTNDDQYFVYNGEEYLIKDFMKL